LKQVNAALADHPILENSSTLSVNSSLEDIQAFGPPIKKPNGILTLNYYKDLFALISKHCRLRFYDEKKDLINKRRVALKSENTVAYK
jgi:hypothetical protein